MLTTSEVEEARRSIERQLSRLRGQVGDERSTQKHQRFADIAGTSPDSADRSVADELVESGNQRIGRDTDTIRELEEALLRLQAGTFGRCTDCGKAIGKPRIAANPSARRCPACQTIFERAHPIPADDGHRPQ
jgi:RNA polymerase-binding transcription factor DksA